MIKFIKNFFKIKETITPEVSRRFPFGESIEYNGKVYRYLYTFGENDVLMRDDDEPRIFFIPSKFIVAD